MLWCLLENIRVSIKKFSAVPKVIESTPHTILPSGHVIAHDSRRMWRFAQNEKTLEGRLHYVRLSFREGANTIAVPFGKSF